MDIQWILKPTNIYGRNIEFDIAVGDDVIGNLCYRTDSSHFVITQDRETQYEEGDTEKSTYSFVEALDIITAYAEHYPFDPSLVDYDE